MREEDGTQSSTKQRRSRKTNTANQQNGKQARAAQRPAFDDTEGWKTYWEQQGQPWRTKPEIAAERQAFLTERRNITPDIEQGIYPFKDIQLSRADVEWLLATHESGGMRGPVDWNDESQHDREGLDLRGTDLRYQNLSELPLASIGGGLNTYKWSGATPLQRKMVAVRMESSNLRKTHLEGAHLRLAHLEGAYPRGAYLADADLHLAHLEDTYLREARLEGADLRLAHLERAMLYEAHMERAILRGAHLDGVDLRGAQLAGADLKGAVFDIVTKLEKIMFNDEKLGGAMFSGVHWGDADLSVVDWTRLKYLGDECEAHHRKTKDGKIKDTTIRLNDYRKAVLANRQLAVALQSQGLNEEAAHFAYRAQVLQLEVLRRQRRWLKLVFSVFLFLLAGYGYRPLRSVFWYLVIILVFAMAYYIFGHLPAFPDTIIFSLTSFHGRGFFPGLEGRKYSVSRIGKEAAA